MSDLVIVRRILTTLTAVLVGASALAVVPVALPSAQGEGEPTLATSVAEGLTGTSIQVSGTGCYLPDGITGSDGVLFQLIAPDGSAAASGTLPVERDGTWDAPFVVPAGVPAGTYGVKGTCIAPMYEDLGVVTADPFTVTGAGAPVPERAPVTPRFPSQIEPYPTYDGQSTCSPAPKPGMIAYRDMVMAAYPASSSYGISRDCNVGGTSEHKEGRAWDWANDATTLAGRRRVANFFHWLFATDSYGHRHAMARRLGVMYLIWNRRIFRMYRANEGWTPYTGSSPHTDHVHVSLTRRGGNKRTSFWTMQLDGPNPPPPTDPPPRPRRARAEFEQTARAVDGTFEHAQVGDFDGNGKNDILWYGEGAKPEYIWWGRPGRGFVVADIRAAGRFRPMVGDYDGDGRDDILWYVPGPGQDYLWYGRTDRSWDTKPTRVATRFPGSDVGDFNGDGRDDVFWYGPGDGLDKLWFGRADRHFAPRSLTVGGDFAPTAGDFDGDDRDDVLLFGRGAGSDELWFGRTDRTFDATDRTINQSANPIVGDLDANGRDDIFWYAPGTTPDRVWWGSRNRTFGAGAVTNVAGTYRPAFAGDFDEDGHDDIFWYRAGAAADYIWWFQ
jgi:hypothetical protein